MEPYHGQLDVKCDGPTNHGALTEVCNYVRNTIDFNTLNSPQEKEAMERSLNLGLGKLLNFQHTPRMVWDSFNVESLIGEGSYGRIWKADFQPDGQRRTPVALKQMHPNLAETPNFWMERDLLIALKHERICKLIGAFVHRDVFLVLQLCYGSVSYYKRRITSLNATRFTLHLLEAVKFIHSKNIVHADIKTDNCLISRQNCLVLSDFGSAIILEDETKQVTLASSHGSPGYLDLEANRDKVFSKMTDVFSAACVIFEMDTKDYLLYHQEHPQDRLIYVESLLHGRIVSFSANSQTPAAAMERETLEVRALKSQFACLIRKMIAPQNQRITAEDALSDEPLRKILNAYSSAQLYGEQKRKDFVSRQYPVDITRDFEFTDNSPIFNPGLLTFYYDEQDGPAESTPEKSSPATATTHASGKRKTGSGSDSEPLLEPRKIRKCASHSSDSSSTSE